MSGFIEDMRIEKIIAVITSNVPEQEKSDLLTEIKGDPLLYRKYRSLKNAWALSADGANLPESRIEKAYLMQQAKINDRNPVQFRKLFPFMRYAAVLLIAFAGGILFSQRSAEKTGLTEIIVPPGQVAEMNLPDGSHVWINSDTHLSFLNGFQDEKREVTLKGEAYFQVKKAKNPFIVSTEYGNVTALGTSFNVYAYCNSKFQATLVEGIIKYSNNKDQREVLLSAGQQVVHSAAGSVDVRKVKTELFTSWRDGVLIFRKEPLHEVIKRLERHFAVKIELQDSVLEDIRFTGNIEGENLMDVMEYINKTKPIQYAYDNKQKKLTIKQK